jgi:hypothetical protein
MSIMYQHGAQPENWEHHNVLVRYCECTVENVSCMYIHWKRNIYKRI